MSESYEKDAMLKSLGLDDHWDYGKVMVDGIFMYRERIVIDDRVFFHDVPAYNVEVSRNPLKMRMDTLKKFIEANKKKVVTQ